MDSPKITENEELERLITPQEACNRTFEVVQEAVRKMEIVADEKMQQVEELESIVRLKQAEAEMFQLKANEAGQEAEQLQSIALSKSEKAEQDYTSLYLKRRLEEAEAEKQYIFEKIKLQESRPPPPQASSSGAVAVAVAVAGDPSQMMMLSKIQDLLKNVRSMPSGKSDGQKSK